MPKPSKAKRVTVTADLEAADAAFDAFELRMQVTSPALFAGRTVHVTRETFAGLLRSTFTLGFEAGENNALSKISQ